MVDEDRAFSSGAALLDLGEREALLEVRGGDAEDYLQRRISCDLRRASAIPGGGAAIPGTLMTAKGKLIAPFVLWRVPRASAGPAAERFLLSVERPALAPLRAELERLVILEEVEIAERPLSILSVQGPAADRVLQGESAGGEPLPARPLEFATLEIGAPEPGLVMRRSRSPAGGFDLIVPSAAREGLRARLATEGALPVGEAAIERHRIAAGIPRFGVDATSENLPTECGYDDAIAYDKGCYAGQEVVARIRTYGHVNRRLCRLRIAGGTVPRVGAEIRAASGPEPAPEEGSGPGDPPRAIGAVTSADRAPVGDHAVALGSVRYRSAIAGSTVVVDGAGDAVIDLVIGTTAASPPGSSPGAR